MSTIIHRRAVSIGVFAIALLAPGSVRAQSTLDPSPGQPAIPSGVTAGDTGQDDSPPASLPALLGVKGTDSFQRRYSPVLGPDRFAYGRALGEGQPTAHGRDALWNGALIGAAVGAGIGVAVTHGLRDSDLGSGQYARGALVFAAMGAGVGLGIDALLNRVSSGPIATPRRVLRKSSRIASRSLQIAIASVARATAMTRRSSCKPETQVHGRFELRPKGPRSANCHDSFILPLSVRTAYWWCAGAVGGRQYIRTSH